LHNQADDKFQTFHRLDFIAIDARTTNGCSASKTMLLAREKQLSHAEFSVSERIWFGAGVGRALCVQDGGLLGVTQCCARLAAASVLPKARW
jgi:hypothetical protein